MLRKLLAAACFALLASAAQAQTTGQGATVQGAVVNRSTVNSSLTITTGNTFQQALPSLIGTSTQRQALTIQNNNTTSTENCWVFFGTTAAATEAKSILLTQGQAYTRGWPYVPSDAVQVTCSSNSDTIYVDNQ